MAVTLGLRHDRYSTVGSATTPRLALVFHPTHHGSIKLLYGEAFRALGTLEYMAAGVRNTSLGPEHLRSFEALWEQQLSEQFSGKLSLYSLRMRGLIEMSGGTTLFADQFTNKDDVNARGIEAGLSAQFGPDWGAYVRSALQRAEDVEQETVLANSPALTLKLGLAFPLSKSFDGTIEVRSESGRRTLRDGRTDGFVIADAHVRSRPIFGHLRLGLSVHNLFDTDYWLPAAYKQKHEQLLQPGRLVALRMSYVMR